VWIVFNGEIYNYRELRHSLRRQHAFRSQSDTEVLLHAYEEMGSDVVHHLDGMFAFSIVDVPRTTICLARDHFGIKPLHYSMSEGELVFASEIKGILAADGSRRQLDRQALNDFFDYHWIPAPRTIYDDVHKLPPATWLEINWSTWQVRSHRYWRATYAPVEGRRMSEWEDEVLHELQGSVARQLVADVELGAFLSGGIDSTLVTSYAADHRGRGLKTFTIDFEESESSEGAKAREVAEQLGVEATFQTLPNSTVDDLQSLSYFYDEPFADTSLLPTVAVSRVARQQVTVALSGDGGDELFTGYSHHDLAYRLMRMDWIPSAMLTGACSLAGRLFPRGTRASEWLHRFAQSPERRRLSLVRMPARGRRREVIVPTLCQSDEARMSDYWNAMLDMRGIPPITQVQLWDLEFYLPNDMLVKVDRASMSVSLEVRVPMLCPRLADLAFRIPEKVRYQPECPKSLLRALVSRRYSDRIARAPKMGFAIPRRPWMRSAAGNDLEQRILSGRAVTDGILQPAGVRQLFQNVRTNTGNWFVDRTDELFALLVFHYWWERFHA